MKKKEEPRKSPKKEVSKKSKSSVNDIIQKIVDAHMIVDQSLAEMSFACKSKDCEGK